MLLQEENAVTLGLSTGQALGKLRDQLSSLLEQHQRTARRRTSLQVDTRMLLSAMFYSLCCPLIQFFPLPEWFLRILHYVPPLFSPQKSHYYDCKKAAKAHPVQYSELIPESRFIPDKNMLYCRLVSAPDPLHR